MISGPARQGLFIIRFLLIGALLCGIWIVFNVRHLQQYVEVRERRDREREGIERLQRRISDLKKQQQSLQQNGLETERQTRERLNMHRAGERVIYLKPDSSTSGAAGNAATTSVESILKAAEKLPSPGEMTERGNSSRATTINEKRIKEPKQKPAP